MSAYYVKRKDSSRPQGPYSVARLKRYVEEQRLWMHDEISKDKITWKKAGNFEQLFSIYVDSAEETYTLSAEPYEKETENEVNSDTVSTILENIPDYAAIQAEMDELEKDEAFENNYRAQRRATYLLFSTIFVFGVSFGFGLFLTLSSILC